MPVTARQRQTTPPYRSPRSSAALCAFSTMLPAAQGDGGTGADVPGRSILPPASRRPGTAAVGSVAAFPARPSAGFPAYRMIPGWCPSLAPGLTGTQGSAAGASASPPAGRGSCPPVRSVQVIARYFTARERSGCGGRGEQGGSLPASAVRSVSLAARRLRGATARARLGRRCRSGGLADRRARRT